MTMLYNNKEILQRGNVPFQLNSKTLKTFLNLLVHATADCAAKMRTNEKKAFSSVHESQRHTKPTLSRQSSNVPDDSWQRKALRNRCAKIGHFK